MHSKVWWELTFQPKGLANFENSFGYVQRAGLECNSIIGTTAVKALERYVSWKLTYIRCKLNRLNLKTFIFLQGRSGFTMRQQTSFQQNIQNSIYSTFESGMCCISEIRCTKTTGKEYWVNISLLLLKILKFDNAFTPGSHFCWHLLCLTA